MEATEATRSRSWYLFAMQSWAGLIEALGDTAARLQLRPGANEGAITAAEAVIGYRLPADYRAWLAIAR